MENEIVNSPRSGMSVIAGGKALEKAMQPADDQTPVVTSIFTTEVKLRCPHCNEVEDGFIGNPAGLNFDCDWCGKPYKVHAEADIDFGY